MLKGKDQLLEASNLMILALIYDQDDKLVNGQYEVWGGRHRTLAQARMTATQVESSHWETYLCHVVDLHLLSTDEIWDLGTVDNSRHDLQGALKTTNLGQILSIISYLDDKLTDWKVIIGKPWLKKAGATFLVDIQKQFVEITITNLPKIVTLAKALTVRGLMALKLLENSILFILDRKWTGFPTTFLYSGNLHKFPDYVITTVCYLLCNVLTPMGQGHNPWTTQDFVNILTQPHKDEIFADFQHLITPLMASGHPTADVVLTWFNVGYLALTYLTFQCNAYPVEDVFMRLDSKKFQVKLKDSNGDLVANTGESLKKDSDWMKTHNLFALESEIRLGPAATYLFFCYFSILLGFCLKSAPKDIGRLDPLFNAVINQIGADLQRQYADKLASNKHYFKECPFDNFDIESCQWHFFEQCDFSLRSSETKSPRGQLPAPDFGWTDMNWKSEHLSRFYDDWGTLKLFKKRETKQIFVWFYFHLTRFLLIDNFVPLVDWISGPEGKSTSQSTRYSFYMQLFRNSFMQKFPSVIDVNKKNLSEEGRIEDSSTYLTLLSIPAPIDSFASNSEELVKKLATIDRSPIFLSVNDLDELRSYNLTDSDSKEEQFNFSYIWIDCLVKTINQYCEANNING